MISSRQSSSMSSQNQSHKNHSSNAYHQSQVVVVVVPFPAQGHLNPLLQLSRQISAHNIPVHFAGTATHNRQATVRVQGWDPKSISNIHFHDFKVPPFVTPLPNPNAETKFPSHLLPSFETASSHLREPVAALLRSLSPAARRVIVIHDSLMASVVQDAAEIANAESYTFHSVSAFIMFLHHWEGMGKPLIESTHIPKEVPSIEGCFPAQFLDFMSSQHAFHKFNKGYLYSTTRTVEGPYMELLERIIGSKKHWALGPFNPLNTESKSNKTRHLCLEWLDKQKPKSVIYVCFGTTTAFTEEQIKELAIGLERSEQKFIWVLREADKGDVFKGEVKRAELPKEFEERTEGIGLVVKNWAPQLEILSHPSTGGFMSHCGWNSCMESLTVGIPIAAWPMHSDQPRNSALLTKVLKVGVVVKDWARRDEIVTASDIEKAVRKLMTTKEGDEMRKSAINLKNSIRRSMEEGGASRLELDNFIAHITR